MDQYNKIILFIAWIMVSLKFLMVTIYAWYDSFMSDSAWALQEFVSSSIKITSCAILKGMIHQICLLCAFGQNASVDGRFPTGGKTGGYVTQVIFPNFQTSSPL